MKRTHNVHSFFAGVLVTVLTLTLALPAGAALAGKTIQVYTGVDVYVDDVKLEPKDANGNPVEVFVYNGTTYLPIRAVGEAVGKVVQWDAKSSSAYLGQHTGEKPAVWLKDLDYFMNNNYTSGEMMTYENDKDNLGNLYSQAWSAGELKNIYMINGQYSKLTGTLYQRYDNRSSDSESTLKIYGDGDLLYSATMSGGIKPIDFSVDLTGILELTVEFTGPYEWGSGKSGYAAVGNCGLWT